MARVCPECKQGKCVNCTGSAWNDETDTLDQCRCEETLHGMIDDN